MARFGYLVDSVIWEKLKPSQQSLGSLCKELDDLAASSSERKSWYMQFLHCVVALNNLPLDIDPSFDFGMRSIEPNFVECAGTQGPSNSILKCLGNAVMPSSLKLY
eukprot:831490_1